MSAADTVDAQAIQGVPRWVRATAVAGTVVIALGAFWLSYTALEDLAQRSGIQPSRAWVWPLIIDGIIVVATISVVALSEHGRRATRYPWCLLISGAGVSVTANAIHAVIDRAVAVPATLAACVSAVPPLVLLAITHLTVLLTRHATIAIDPTLPRADSSAGEARAPEAAAHRYEPADAARDRRGEAQRLHACGWSNRRIAEAFGVHPSTIGRWLRTGDGTGAAAHDGESDAPSWGEPTEPPLSISGLVGHSADNGSGPDLDDAR